MQLGCTAFLSMGTHLLASDITIAIYLGFKNEAHCSRSAVKLARSILLTSLTHCLTVIEDVVAATELLVSPPPLHPLTWRQPSFETTEEGTDDDEAERCQTLEPTYNSLTLRFDNPQTEASFILIVYGTYWPNVSKFGNLGSVEGVQRWRVLICYLPMVLAFAAQISLQCRKFYIQNREKLIAYTYLTSLHWHMHTEHAMGSVPTEFFTRPIYVDGFSWLIITVLLFHLRFPLLLPLTIVSFAVYITLVPKICTKYYSEIPGLLCIGQKIAKIGFCLSSALMLNWSAERRCRREFLRRLRGD